MKKIHAWEPWFFLFFGLFHLHRVWGLIHRASYADFWLGVLENKGLFYYALMGFLAFLCLCGLVVFCKHMGHNPWWRWIYLFGGSYVLFDLFAIAVGMKAWHDLLLWMFDIHSPCWNLMWGFFVALGAFVFGLGIRLLRERNRWEESAGQP